MRYPVNLKRVAEKLQERELLGRVSIEDTKGGLDVVIRIGFNLRKTAEDVAAALMGEPTWQENDSHDQR